MKAQSERTGYSAPTIGRERFHAGFRNRIGARFFYTAKADADDRLGSKHPTVKPSISAMAMQARYAASGTGSTHSLARERPRAAFP